ncbi:MAG: 4Fe-4S dicluster domain-containing protein [Ignavibacteriae bacterium]|nr:4Fe-4S dicluster domain-containing protein [Ignavibacteriota bacterium]
MSDQSFKNKIQPREVADKSIEGNLRKALEMALDVESKAVRENTQSFNNNRYAATARINDYELLKNKVRRIKEESIANLPNLLLQLEESIKANGGYFFLAKTAEEASKYVTNICTKHEAKLVVKAKSITSEEIKLNDYLEDAGIEVAETDLAEFILQVSDEQPSHIVAPAIHRSRERISELFKEKFNTELPLETGEDLTKFARDILREKFLTADVGISGANVISADSGTLLLVESEGNIRMVTQAPSVHIAIAGVEKIIPNREYLWHFLELLAPSATGQDLTSYTQILKPPLKVPPFSFDGREIKDREFHLVLIDNGRMAMREDTVLREALYCIRCSACMNVCANFQAVGGHAFGGETYPGGIGGSWEAGTGNLEKSKFSDLCTGCSRCVTVCPVKIDIPWLNENLRNRFNKKNNPEALSFVFKGLLPTEEEDKSATLQKQFFSNYNFIAKWGSRFPNIINGISNTWFAKKISEKLLQVDRRRNFQKFSSDTLIKQFPRLKAISISSDKIEKKVLLFADVFTNHSRPSAGIATVKVFNKFGLNTTISNVGNEGRDSLSQGFLATTKKRAIETSEYLLNYISNEYDIVVVEPSILALFKKDYNHFIYEKKFNSLKENCFEPMEYLSRMVKSKKIDLRTYFDIEAIQKQPKMFFHSHCQQRSIDVAKPTIDLLHELGFEVDTSSVECCGMAGSFGYKKQYYDLSVRVGEDLVDQIKKSKSPNKDMVVLASGVSCHEQINDLAKTNAIHPMELLSQFLK